MNDPYQILGVGKNATDEEIKQAYKDLMRKYHPDNYAGNPLADLADEKAKEINQAYDEIMALRKGSSSGKSGEYTSSSTNTQFADIRRMISAGRAIEAEELLNGMPQSKRNGEWHFLKGTILYQRGWLSEAIRYFKTATELDPYNLEYRKTYERFTTQQSGNFSGNPYGGYRTRGSDSGCSCCLQLIALDCCCECLGGDLISCC